METLEQTLVLIKPDGVKRELVGEIISRFEKVGLKIIGIKMVQISKDMAFKHYGYNDEWFETVGERMKEFYKKIGYDAGEDFSKLSHKDIGKLVQKWNVNYLIDGAVVALVLEGPYAIEIVRKIAGSTYPAEALPGTIRGDYSVESPLTSNLQKRSVRNLVHASGTKDEAKLEIELWFKKEELYN
jgi:nucleoside-diphosphate kinase